MMGKFRSRPDLMYMFSIMQAIFWSEHNFHAAMVSSLSLLRPLKRIQLSRCNLRSLSLYFLFFSRHKMLWASLLILAMQCCIFPVWGRSWLTWVWLGWIQCLEYVWSPPLGSRVVLLWFWLDAKRKLDRHVTPRSFQSAYSRGNIRLIWQC